MCRKASAVSSGSTGFLLAEQKLTEHLSTLCPKCHFLSNNFLFLEPVCKSNQTLAVRLDRTSPCGPAENHSRAHLQHHPPPACVRSERSRLHADWSNTQSFQVEAGKRKWTSVLTSPKGNWSHVQERRLEVFHPWNKGTQSPGPDKFPLLKNNAFVWDAFWEEMFKDQKGYKEILKTWGFDNLWSKTSCWQMQEIQDCYRSFEKGAKITPILKEVKRTEWEKEQTNSTNCQSLWSCVQLSEKHWTRMCSWTDSIKETSLKGGEKKHPNIIVACLKLAPKTSWVFHKACRKKLWIDQTEAKLVTKNSSHYI